MNEYNSVEFPWEWPCANLSCTNPIEEEGDLIGFTMEEFKPRQVKILLNAVFCSQKCLETALSGGTRFKEKLRNYHAEEKPRPRRNLSEEHFCSYCGKSFKDEDYHLSLLAFGRIQNENQYVLANIFCSNDCYHKALSLGPQYYKHATAVSVFSPENCIKNQLKRGTKSS